MAAPLPVMILCRRFKLNVVKHQQQQPLTLPLHVVDAFRALLLDEQLAPALAAQILTFPSENEMGELFATIDPEAISAVHEAIVRCLAEEMADEWLAVYHANKTDSYRVEHSDIAKRTLRNVCLGYLAFGEDMALADKRVSEQYYQADNMTDLLAAFDERWHNDGLVMDKWFVLQGSSPAADVLNKVRGLLQHRSFSLNDPNRSRSLIGGFASGNPAAFHAADGSGYQFLVEILSDLNQRNPQIAARLIEPLIRLKRYDAGRRALMRQALEQLKGLENLSGNLYEKISKALNA